MNDQSGRSSVARTAHVGRGLLSGGYVLVSVGLGIALGYWASDWEIRFFPTVVVWVLLLCAGGLSFFALGAQMEREEKDGRRFGRRAAASTILAAVALGGMSAVYLGSRPTALTAMADHEIDRTHELDARYFRDLDRSLRTIVARVEARFELFTEGSPRVPDDEEEAFLLDAWVSYLDTAMALDEIRRFHEDFYRFDLSRMERAQHVKSFLLSFACELSIYENTNRLMSLFDRNENVERFLDVARPERSLEKDSVAQVREELAGLTDLGRVAAGGRYLSYLDRLHQARAEMAGEGFDWLWGEVEYYIARVERRSTVEAVTLSASSDFAPVLRGVKNVTFPVQKTIAEWMGDTKLKRAGGHYLISRAQAEAMEVELRPGDVLLSRKNWYLSNIGLPGFWPHAIFYVGTNGALASAFDSDPEVAAWVEKSAGRRIPFTEYLAETYPLAWRRRELSGSGEPPLTVIEAVSEGVLQNSLFAASGDFLVAMRPRLPAVVKARAVFRAFGFLDRPYDFDFDFATDHALVCTEVVWRAYRPSGGLSGLDLKLRSIAGRLTLPANDIARAFRDELSSEDRKLDFVSYLEGREREERAVVSDVAAFVATPDRSKWDFGDP